MCAPAGSDRARCGRPAMPSMRSHARQAGRVHIRPQSLAPLPERLYCSICGFGGNSTDVDPGENCPTGFVTAGSTYAWTSASDALSLIDKTVTPVPNPQVSCAFCGGTMLLTGRRGQGQ